jgi:SAM-dependent methyltransferase
VRWRFARQSGLYEQPRNVRRIEDCDFFHTMDLPGHGTVRGLWDLRPTIDAYLGSTELAGKRVLDVGAASGHLTFEMEKRGAEVVSLEARRWEEVPYPWARAEADRRQRDLDTALERLKNGYWLAHRAVGFRARVHYGDVYDVPEILGRFDMVVMGMLLGHLRDPVGAIASISRLGCTHVVVTEGAVDDERPIGYFAPDPAARMPTNVWWSMSPGCVMRMLGLFGFDVIVSRTSHRCLHAPGDVAREASADVAINTFVGRRLAP